jgi:hypothetical protein
MTIKSKSFRFHCPRLIHEFMNGLLNITPVFRECRLTFGREAMNFF